ncbi:MAG: DUF433 domain-containing protein [Chloroflexota bacterium]|nr:DUF433 domain-containing protein [Chloroflexota bacterium]
MEFQIPVQHITVENGKAFVGERRVKVKMVARLYLNGVTVEQVMEQYDLSAAEVFAALAYYHDNRDSFKAEEIALQPMIDSGVHDTKERLEKMRQRAAKKDE